MDIEILIARALDKAPYVKGGGTGRTGISAGGDRMVYIEYHTSGRVNVCDYSEILTTEHFDWKMHNCKNNREWRQYLNKQFWNNL